ncbi:RING finger and transmembrane domain-containing protein 2-like [Zingiber officinale]|uniref:RING-type domain-containing protein n=1 Tax=Zingiber officinale TaxID=94328 RepID=A0A8J5HZ18_ZINOF|nr:RING finger and transmembrane domain-containing protein 2-like [Zingiber officinale]KAG6523132.1 hypothetical protein ZIOFF_012985 [Zingiber officinale]
MESSGGSLGSQRSRSASPSDSSSRRYSLQLTPSNFIRARLSDALEHLGILRTTAGHAEEASSEASALIGRDSGRTTGVPAASIGSEGEVAIRIIGAGDQESLRAGTSVPLPPAAGTGTDGGSGGPGSPIESISSSPGRQVGGEGSGDEVGESASSASSSPASFSSAGGRSVDGEANATGGTSRDSVYQRYDIQQIARWIEQILPFSLLLLVVFIRQHLQGFFVTIWIAAVMFKSNDILRKQTALKGERKIYVLFGITFIFIIHIFGVYWWYRNDDLLYPLIMLPPREIPPFWHAIFIIVVNDILMRQVAMVLKCLLLICYKNSRGHNYRKQGKLLTLVEYFLLLYRSLLPTPVWYRFFLNKEYGSLFSSLTTGLYLTFKLTSVIEKIQSFFAALKALSQKIYYGSYATTEQVVAAGDLCTICQEKMHAPISLQCKHIFCEDCVSEWFERERTCPLCRALVKTADLRSFADGSTSLFFQLF